LQAVRTNPFAPRLSIDGLTGVGQVELELDADRRACVFLGENGVGKTKLLEALHLLTFLTSELVLANKELQIRRLAASALVFSSICVGGKKLQVRPGPSSGFPLDRSQGTFGPENHALPWAYVGAKRRGLVDGANGVRTSPLGTFSERRVSHVQTLVRSVGEGRPGLDAFTDIRVWFVQRAQSSNRFQTDQDNREAEILTVLRLMNTVDARVDPTFLSVDGSEQVRIRIDGVKRQLSELSSGFASLLQLMQTIVASYASFTQEAAIEHVRGIVFIDEIESHLHVGWQATILSALKKALPNTFFVVATHSPLVIAQCDEGEVYRLMRDEEGIVRSQRLDAPRRDALVDVLQAAFDVDVNALKRDSMSSESQRDAKAGLIDLLARS